MVTTRNAPAGLAGAVLSLVLLGCTGAPVPTSAALRGHLTLENGEPTDRAGGDCRGTGGFDDLRAGVEVIVRDAAGVIVGRSGLVVDATYAYSNGCRFAFDVALADPGSAFYVVSVGLRGDRTYSRADLEAAGWRAELAIGG